MGLANAEAILHELAREERCNVYEDRVRAKRLRLKREAEALAAAGRHARLAAEAALFLSMHGLPHLPRLFSPLELDDLNRARPADDQLELMPCGLLRHHCCFPGCDHYLENFSTARDRKLGQRNGLFAHLKYYVTPNRKYWNGLHVIAASHRRRPENEFVERVVEDVNKNSPRMKKYNDYLEASARALYAQLNNTPVACQKRQHDLGFSPTIARPCGGV